MFDIFSPLNNCFINIKFFLTVTYFLNLSCFFYEKVVELLIDKDVYKMFNSHIHTNHSRDCKTSMEEMCIAAINAGFSGIAITDHYNGDSCISDNSYRNILMSVAEARKFDELYGEKLTVLGGVETSDVLRKPDYTARFLKNLRPDSVIFSVHNVFIDSITKNLSRMDFGVLTDEEAYRIINVYFKELVEGAVKADYDILAHLTLPLRYTNGKHGKKLSLDRFNAEIEKILTTLIKREKALEINTSEIDHQLFDFMPGKNILKKYYGLGGRLVTIGTDAHKSENIAVGFNEAKELLKEIGFESYYYYKNRKPIPVTL